MVESYPIGSPTPNPEPGKFGQSGPFRALLAEFVIEWDGSASFVIHEACAEQVVIIENDQDVSTIVQAVIDHDC